MYPEMPLGVLHQFGNGASFVHSNWCYVNPVNMGTTGQYMGTTGQYTGTTGQCTGSIGQCTATTDVMSILSTAITLSHTQALLVSKPIHGIFYLRMRTSTQSMAILATTYSGPSPGTCTCLLQTSAVRPLDLVTPPFGNLNSSC